MLDPEYIVPPLPSKPSTLYMYAIRLVSIMSDLHTKHIFCVGLQTNMVGLTDSCSLQMILKSDKKFINVKASEWSLSTGVQPMFYRFSINEHKHMPDQLMLLLYPRFMVIHAFSLLSVPSVGYSGSGTPHALGNVTYVTLHAKGGLRV